MKRVSFEVAKAIKEAGYPQLGVELWYTIEGKYINGCSKERYAICPTCLEAWIWLWQNKNIKIVVSPNCLCIWIGLKCVNFDSKLTNNPEQDIMTAIEYLVNNDLIK